jgi:hypothetical protein
MQKVILTFLIILVIQGLACAEDYVCEDTVITGKYSRYLPSVSATQITLKANELCTAVSKADTEAQRAINLGNPNATPSVPPSVLFKYRKVVNHLVVEMDAGEKATVDAAIAADQAIKAPWQAEVATPEACPYTTLAELNTDFDNEETALAALVAATPAGAVQDALDGIVTSLLTKERLLTKLLCARIKAGK